MLAHVTATGSRSDTSREVMPDTDAGLNKIVQDRPDSRV